MRYLASLILALSILLPMKVKSQNTTLSLEDLIPGGKTFRKYYPKTPQGLAWYGDLLTQQKGDSILAKGNKIGESKVLLTLKELNEALGDKEQVKSLNSLSIGKETNILFVRTMNHIYAYDKENNKIVASFNTIAGIAGNDISEQSLYFAYTKGNNLFVQDSKGNETAITDEENTKIVYGQSVHQNEFGISKGTFWSPKGNLLAYYRMDESMVGVYPLVNTAARMAELKERIYPMAGMKSHHVTIGVYNTKTNDTIFLKTGTPKEKFLTNIAWSPDESTIYVAELNRGQDSLVMNSYDAATGKRISTLFTEEHPKYVEPENPILFVKNDPSKFIWQSRRDGYNHLYLYSKEGKLLKQITKGNFDVVSVADFDEKGENIVYTSTEGGALEQQIYKVNLKDNKRTKLSNQAGVHSARLSRSGKYLFDWFSSQNNPCKVTSVDVKTGLHTAYYKAENPYKGIVMPEITLGSVKANDGKTDLYYRLVKPTNFDASKKYPVVVYVYGGPHSQLVTNSWRGGAGGWDIYMANNGYVVFTLDNRGTARRGFDFENITHRQLGIVETEDQMAGVEFLKSQPYVDADRIGVHGWSYGGFMTLNLMLRHPETFKVGVAGGPVVDWKYYEIMYGERYMDSPQENPDGYKESNMTNHIGNLQGRLLLIHGDVDPVVLMQHTSQLLRSAVKEGVHPDLFVYPGHEHNVMGKDRIHLYEHITRYFEDFLR